jgi:hypothetical protein
MYCVREEDIYESVPLRIVDPCDSGQLIQRQSRREVATFRRLYGFKSRCIIQNDLVRSESAQMESQQNTSMERSSRTFHNTISIGLLFVSNREGIIRRFPLDFLLRCR